MQVWTLTVHNAKIHKDHIHNKLYYLDTISLECLAISDVDGTSPRERDLGPAIVMDENLVVMFGGSSGGPVNFVDYIHYTGV